MQGAVETRPAGTPPALAAASVCEAFQITVAERPDQVALRTPDDRVAITFGEYARRVEELAGGLAGLGVGRGDSVGIMLTNRPEFHLIDTAALHLGATPFSIYNTSAPEQIVHLLGNAGNRVLVTERAFLGQVSAALATDDLPVEHLVLVDDAGEEGAIPLADLPDREPSDFHFEQSWRAVEPGDVLTLIYTSGTTGPPKGVELTHANMVVEVRGMFERLPVSLGGRVASFLPAAHLADRWGSHYHGSIFLGATITSIADPRTVIEHLPDVRPTAWGAVPRIWEKLRAGLEAAGIAEPAALPEEQRVGIRAGLGLDALESVVAGAAPTPPDVLRYFAELGIAICELWGMSELSCCVTCNPRERINIGTCGPPIEGAEVELADDGEIVVRGPLVMRGYRGEPEKTREAIDRDGWFHTGDIGAIDDDGYLAIVDRKKELIINSAGKNMSPANIEAKLKSASALIGQCACVGDRRPYNVALIVLDPEAAGAFARERGLADDSIAALAVEPEVGEAVAAAVEEANSHLSRVEQVKRFKILGSDWLPDSDELTPTMKLKRRVIATKYADEIETLYR